MGVPRAETDLLKNQKNAGLSFNPEDRHAFQRQSRDAKTAEIRTERLAPGEVDNVPGRRRNEKKLVVTYSNKSQGIAETVPICVAG